MLSGVGRTVRASQCSRSIPIIYLLRKAGDFDFASASGFRGQHQLSNSVRTPEHIKDESVDLIYLDPPFNSR
jgi:16S rRNA G966 N2-methylase RsmD